MARRSLRASGVNAPSNIGQYRILRKIGAGGMGTVYLGEHLLLGRQAAIKTLLPSLAVHQEIVERFFNEARATSGITDPGVVQVFDFGYHVDGTAYIVMELLEGEALSARLDRLGGLPFADALRIARQVASSLGTAHSCGVVHRDLKPENVFLIHDAEAECGERTKILDFGICKVDDANDHVHTQTGTTLGTPAYMSPEQCRGAGDIDHRSDIYSLGCVLFHMLTGRAPFELEGSGEYIVAHLQEQPPAPSSLVPALPQAVDDLIAKCLAKAPDDRFASMGELIVAIEDVLSAMAVPSVEGISVVAHLPRPARPTPPPPKPITRARPTVQAKRSVTPGGAQHRLSIRIQPPAPKPTTLGTATGEADVIELPKSRSTIRGTLAIVAIAAAITAFVATRFMGDAEEPREPTANAASIEPAAAIQPAPTPDAGLPATAPAPVEATVAHVAPAPEPALVADAISSVTPPLETAVVAKKPKPARQTSSKPRPRPTVARSRVEPSAPTPSKPAPAEDLYDTR